MANHTEELNRNCVVNLVCGLIFSARLYITQNVCIQHVQLSNCNL